VRDFRVDPVALALHRRERELATPGSPGVSTHGSTVAITRLDKAASNNCSSATVSKPPCWPAKSASSDPDDRTDAFTERHSSRFSVPRPGSPSPVR
jgi:hypothetical protein